MTLYVMLARPAAAMLLLAAPLAAQGRGGTSVGVRLGGVPAFMVGSLGADVTVARSLLPHLSARLDAEAYVVYSVGISEVSAPCLTGEPCPSATDRSLRGVQLLSAGLQLWELPQAEGVYASVMAGAARLYTGSGTGVHPVWAVGGGILFGSSRPGFSIDVRRVQLPASFAERAIWPITVGLHF